MIALKLVSTVLADCTIDKEGTIVVTLDLGWVVWLVEIDLEETAECRSRLALASTAPQALGSVGSAKISLAAEHTWSRVESCNGVKPYESTVRV